MEEIWIILASIFFLDLRFLFHTLASLRFTLFRLSKSRFLICPKHAPQHIAHFTQCRVSADALQDIRHQILVRRRGATQCFKTCLHTISVAGLLEHFELLPLAPGGSLVYNQELKSA